MKIAVHGYGAMGKIVVEKINERTELKLVGIIDDGADSSDYYIHSLDELQEKPDVIIDFSHYTKLEPLVEYCKENQVALFVATTGHTDEQKKYAQDNANRFPLIMATNTSLGVNLLNEIMGKIVPVLNEWDIELIEKHHNKKIDSPSGTAKTLLEKINQALTEEKSYKYGRSGIEKRDKNEIGVHSLRGGTIVGEHSVIFAGEDEVIEIKHEAHSKRIFANGALKGAMWLASKGPGIYQMRDVLFN
ncbi:MAG: 4-hydroxy-tetrahydrodipicolinate reductase [Fusobacteriaceae bacterium]